MPSTLLVGLDGAGSGDRALAYAKRLASRVGDCEIVVIFVVEWSPFTFQTPDENAERHQRKEEETALAMERVINPAVASLQSEGFTASGKVQHGHVAEVLIRMALEVGAEQIIIGRSSEGGFAKRVFGSSTVNLVMHASTPVTVVA